MRQHTAAHGSTREDGEVQIQSAIPAASPDEGSDPLFEQLLEAAPDAILGVDQQGRIVLVNTQAETLFGYPRSQLVGASVETLVPKRFRGAHAGHRDGYFQEPRRRPMGNGISLYARQRGGTEFPAEISLSSLVTDDGPLAIAAVRDISDRAESERERALQRQLDRARRLESVGQLAGGVAHDFNNILAVILNYAEFISEGLPADSPARADVHEIRRAAERAATLTRQLLIFSRREVVKPEVLLLREVVADLENLLQRALGERVELVTRFGEERLPVKIDPGQLEQVLVNLAVNARDAMPDGGRLVVEVEPALLDEEYAYMHPDTTPGRYVRLKVSDTGIGMTTETLERIFEPFFTTKEEGTGLGLATVYGIVTAAGGRIDVYSEQGIGTTVSIHLPASEEGPSQGGADVEERPQGRGEFVLIVEDEDDVRRMSERILTRNGYSVLTTDTGMHGLECCGEAGQRIDILLSDVIMPGMLGTELVAAARELRPGLPVVFMSGYSHEVLAAEALSPETGSAFLEKPFSGGELLRSVRQVLDRRLPDDGN